MNIHEIETILETLYARHTNLDEKMLVTLLTAGGWEEKTIRDAVVLFRATHRRIREANTTPHVLLTSTEEKNLLPESVDIAHTLTERTVTSSDKEMVIAPLMEDTHTAISLFEDSAPVIIVEKVEEPTKESELVIHKEVSAGIAVDKQEDAIPDNLPLRPFESNSHVWPFSLYKDVFHNDVKQKLVAASTAHEKEKSTHLFQENVDTHSLSQKEEKLILLAEIMLGIILLILAYMYSNGRL